MFPHYTPIEPFYCSGLDLAGQASGVALVEQELMVVVGQAVEAKEREESFIGASTPDEMHSIEAKVEHRIEMNGWLVGHGMEM